MGEPYATLKILRLTAGKTFVILNSIFIIEMQITLEIIKFIKL